MNIPSTSPLTLDNKLSANKEATADSIQKRFLTMLVTELQNQDPLNPMDSKDMTAQLAQISTVQGVEKLNERIDRLAGYFQSNQLTQSAHLIGKNVSYQGNTLYFDQSPKQVVVNLPNNSGPLHVDIKNKQGVIIKSIEIPHPNPHQIIQWNGEQDNGSLAANGEYQVEAYTQDQGQKKSHPLYMEERVQSITQDQKGVILLFGQNRGIHLSDAEAISQVTINH